MLFNLKAICVLLSLVLLGLFAAETSEDFIDTNTSAQKQVTTTQNEIELL